MKKFFSVFVFFLIIFISVLFSELFLLILEKRSYSNKFPNAFSFLQGKKEMHIQPFLSPKIYLEDKKINKSIILPISGISKVKTALCNESGKMSVYISDEKGFNNYENLWNSTKQKDLLIGDSFVHGACVDQDQTISAHMNKLNKVNKTMSLGSIGIGPYFELAIIEEYVKHLNPKNVLWFYYEGNDYHDFLYEKKNVILRQYLNNFNQRLFYRQEEIDNFIINKVSEYRLAVQEEKNFFIEILKFRKIKNELNNIKKIYFNYSQKDLIEFSYILDKAKKTTEENGGKLHFVYLPEYSRYEKKFFKKENNFEKNKILDLVKSKNINIIDIDTLLFKKNNDPLNFFYFRKPGHYNDLAYEEIAKIIMKNLYGK